MINNVNGPAQPSQMQNRPLNGASAIVGFDIDKYIDGENDTFQNHSNCTKMGEVPKWNEKKPSNVSSIIGASLLSAVATASTMLLFFKKH